MGRPCRIENLDATFHVVARGNNRAPIVWDDDDRASVVGELGRSAVKYGWRVLAWCLMTNHYHVVLRTPRGGMSTGFQEINGNHARRTNARYGRVGHLFQNRFFSIETKTEAHRVAAMLYVVRNPVAAGLCDHAGAWPDSSYEATAGRCAAPPWLALTEVQGLFGDDPKEAQTMYERTVHSGRLPESDALDAVLRFTARSGDPTRG